MFDILFFSLSSRLFQLLVVDVLCFAYRKSINALHGSILMNWFSRYLSWILVYFCPLRSRNCMMMVSALASVGWLSGESVLFSLTFTDNILLLIGELVSVQWEFKRVVYLICPHPPFAQNILRRVSFNDHGNLRHCLFFFCPLSAASSSSMFPAGPAASSMSSRTGA